VPLWQGHGREAAGHGVELTMRAQKRSLYSVATSSRDSGRGRTWSPRLGRDALQPRRGLLLSFAPTRAHPTCSGTQNQTGLLKHKGMAGKAAGSAASGGALHNLHTYPARVAHRARWPDPPFARKAGSVLGLAAGPKRALPGPERGRGPAADGKSWAAPSPRGMFGADAARCEDTRRTCRSVAKKSPRIIRPCGSPLTREGLQPCFRTSSHKQSKPG
jgi:hypothetical protein